MLDENFVIFTITDYRKLIKDSKKEGIITDEEYQIIKDIEKKLIKKYQLQEGE